MNFAAPSLLFTLLAVPLAAVGYAALESRRARRSGAWSRPAMLPNVARAPSRRRRSVPAALFLLGLTFLLVGFARPQRIVRSSSVGAPTIVLAFDVSGSMAADDVRPTRLRAARTLAIQFLHELPADYRVAVMTFATAVRLAVPPTFDRSRVLSGLPTRVTPLGGTALGDGISAAVAEIATAAGETAVGALLRPGVVLVLSDGGQNAGGTTPEAAALSALVDYVPIDTVAVGTSRGVVTQPVKVNGVRTSVQIPVPASPQTLQTLSKQTGGRFFDAAAAAQRPALMRGFYDDLHPHTAPIATTRALSAAAGGLALLFIAGGVVVSGLWFGRPA